MHVQSEIILFNIIFHATYDSRNTSCSKTFFIKICQHQSVFILKYKKNQQIYLAKII